MRKEILREVTQAFEKRRQENEEVFFRRRQKVIQKCPEIAALMDSRQNLIFAGIRGILDGHAMENVPEKMQALTDEIGKKLVENGFSRDYLEPVYQCSICQDRGYVGDTVREMCSCMKKEMYARLFHAVGLKGGENVSFASYDTNVFPDTQIPGIGMSQREEMRCLKEIVQAWTEQWPNVKRQGGMLFSGSTGIGKTYLMQCAARRLLEREKEVLVMSMYRAQDIMRRAYVKGDEEDLQMLMDVDVLCLDDLGTEPLMENITITQLFNLINERQRQGKALIVSTNLSPKDLRARYTERITSRLLDRSQMEVFEIRGVDIRRG